MATREEIYLAALLHDIGKFWQRADEEWNKSKNITEETKNSINYITRKNQKGYPTHHHVIWTYEFLTGYKQLKDLINLAARHHYPDNEDEAIIQLADWWASGIERDYDENEDALKLGKERYKKQPIGNIFSKVTVTNKNTEEKTAFPLNVLSIKEENFFPVDFNTEAANSQQKYSDLWKKFTNEFNQLISIYSSNQKYFAESLFFLQKKYCWSIPAATNEPYPISSLFEHSKITAAISWCFKVFKEETEGGFEPYQKGSKLKLKKGQLPLLLLCVDLSGIQKFIYNIASKNAAKALRGRSFYLQMLLQDVAREIIHRTDAYQSNIVYSSGGKLFMLLPNTDNTKNIIDELEKKLLEELWEKYSGEIYLCFGYVPFAYDLEVKDNSKPRIVLEGKDEKSFLSELWKAAINKAADKKNKRFIHLILNENKFSEFFIPSGEGGNTDICTVTGKELRNDKKKLDDGSYVSSDVYEQKIIGEKLPRLEFLAFAGKETFIKKEYINLITQHKLRIGTRNEIDFDNAEIFYVLKTGEPEVIPINTNHEKNVWGFTYYGGTSYPMKPNGETKTFEQLAKWDDNDKVNKIGVLRMDVDSLGLMFTKGFKKIDEKSNTTDYSSFSNYATLSGMLDLFFSGYINTIREKDEFKEHVAIIYSGGDDLFAVGKWDKIIEFAYQVQKNFKLFTARPDITISGGIEIVNPKFPIAKAALMTGEAEEKAKDHLYSEQYKNSITLFGIPVNWDKEYNKVVQWKDKFSQWLNDEVITKGLLMKLIGYYEQWIKSDKTDLSWKWNAAYNLARRKSNVKDDSKRQALDEIKNLLFTEVNDNHLRFEALAVALRWAELENRK